MTTSADRWLNAVGVILLLGIAIGLGVVILAGAALGPESGTQPPAVDWTLDRLNESTVRISHAGGDPVVAADLVVTVEGFDRRTAWRGTITEGDATVIAATDGQVVRLYWVPDERGARHLYHRWTV